MQTAWPKSRSQQARFGFVLFVTPRRREQMALICSDRDRLASRKKKRGA